MSKLTTQTVEYEIMAHFLPAIINSDNSGLSNDEIRELNEFDTQAAEYAKRMPGYRSHHWADAGDTDDFSRCEITQCYGQTEKINLVVMVDSAEWLAYNGNCENEH